MLENFKDRHKGESAVLVACGPSLNDIPVKKIRWETTFAVSLAYKKDGLDIDYHFIGDQHIYKQVHQEVNSAINIANLFTSTGIYAKYNTPRNTHCWIGIPRPHFSTDVAKGVHGGGTSTFVAMQFAYYMGIDELFVVGLDHYDTLDEQMKQVKKTGHRQRGYDLVETTGEDVNHFTKDFYPKGTSWYVPQVQRMAESYKMARDAFEADGRRIYNASTHTVLDEKYLPRIDFEELF